MPHKPLNPDIPWDVGGVNALNIAELQAPNDHEAVGKALAGCVRRSFAMMQKDRLPLSWITGMQIGIQHPPPEDSDEFPKAFFFATVVKPSQEQET